MIETSNENGIFTITDQSFPTEVADVLFNAQDAIANGQMEPADAAKEIQAAIENYLFRNRHLSVPVLLTGKGRIFRMKTKKKDSRFGNYVFLIPAAVIYLSVIVVPVFYSLYIS